MDKKSCTYFLFNCPFNCPYKCPFKCPVITYGHNNEKCENKYTICLKLYTFKAHPVINLSTFENPKKTFFIANYSNFNFQNRGFSIKKNSKFSIKKNSCVFDSLNLYLGFSKYSQLLISQLSQIRKKLFL